MAQPPSGPLDSFSNAKPTSSVDPTQPIVTSAGAHRKPRGSTRSARYPRRARGSRRPRSAEARARIEYSPVVQSAEKHDASIRPLRRLEYDRLVDEGFFEGEPIELLWGRLVKMGPQNSSHAAAVQYLTQLFVLAVAPGELATVRIQSPFAATDDSEPEPDVAVVPFGAYRDQHPSEALLVIEVAESSLRADRKKASIYAEAGVPEYWIVNVINDTVEVHRDPDPGEAHYRNIVTYSGSSELSPIGLPGCTVLLAELFGTE